MPKSPRLLDFIEGRSEIGSGILTCTVMLRRHLFEEVKASDPYLYHGGHFLMGDTQLWAELSTRTELHYIAESLATHVITEESATRSKDVKKVLQFSISSAELMLYLCNKYDFTRPYTEKYEDQWCGTSLRLAFHRRDKELANQVRARRKSFTKQEWLRYFGAKFLIIHCTCRMASFLLSFCGQKHDQWL